MKINMIVLAFLVLNITGMAQSQKKHVIALTPGMKVYKKKMRKYCQISGVGFAHSYKRVEWEKLQKEGKLASTIKSICPRLELSSISGNEWREVYTFITTYSLDNPVIPSC